MMKNNPIAFTNRLPDEEFCWVFTWNVHAELLVEKQHCKMNINYWEKDTTVHTSNTQQAAVVWKHLQVLTDRDKEECSALNTLEGAAKWGPGGTQEGIQKGRQENNRRKCTVRQDKWGNCLQNKTKKWIGVIRANGKCNGTKWWNIPSSRKCWMCVSLILFLFCS